MDELDGKVVGRRHLGLGAFSSVVSQLLAMAAGFLLTVVVARKLGPVGSGTYALGANLFDVTMVLASAGLTQGVIYVVSRGEWPLRRAFAESQLASIGLGSAGAAAAGAFYVLTRGNVLQGLGTAAVVVLLVAVPSGIAWNLACRIALARDRYELYALANVLQPAGALILGAALIFPFGVTGALAGYAAGHVLAALMTGYWVRRLASGDPRHEASLDRPLRVAARFGLKTWLPEVFQLLNYRVDLFILSAYVSRSHVGVYAIALSLTAVGWVLPGALQTVVFPRTADLDAAVDRRELSVGESDASVGRAVRQTVLLLIPTAAGLAALLAVVVPVFYGPRFTDTITLGLVLIPGVVLLGLGKVLTAALLGRGRADYVLYISLLMLPLTLLMYFLLIPALGAYGAALASTISYSGSALGTVYAFGRGTRMPLRVALRPTREDVGDLRGGTGLVLRSLSARLRAMFS